jgi:hypothetical protein
MVNPVIIPNYSEICCNSERLSTTRPVFHNGESGDNSFLKYLHHTYIVLTQYLPDTYALLFRAYTSLTPYFQQGDGALEGAMRALYGGGKV